MLNRNLHSSFKPWEASREAFFYLIDRNATNGKGVRARLTAEAFFTFHTVNVRPSSFLYVGAHAQNRLTMTAIRSSWI